MEGALLGAKALMLATTLVVGFTGLGMWAVGKAVGAEDVRSFFPLLSWRGRTLIRADPSFPSFLCYPNYVTSISYHSQTSLPTLPSK